MTRRLKVAAVQPALQRGRVEENLARIEDLVRDAYRVHRPDLIVLPEAITSPNAYHPEIRSVPRPIDGPALTLMSHLATDLNCVIAGGSLCVRGRHAYSTYMLVEPDGRAHLHDKNIPSGPESYFNRGGDDDGVTAVAAWGRRRVGLASGMEWARTRTAGRLRAARVELVVGGLCWPGTAVNWWGPIGRRSRAEHARSVGLCRSVPAIMARLVGVPTVMASHVGDITMDTPLLPGVAWRSPMVGQTHICDRDGTTLALMTETDSDGHIGALVELGDPQPRDEVPKGYWTTAFGKDVRAMFHLCNAVGTAAYTVRSWRGAFPWQDGLGVDLPDEVPPGADPGPERIRRVAVQANAATEVTVRGRHVLADGVVGLTLASADGTPLPRWRPGAHIDLLLGNDLVRQYSLCGDPSLDEYNIAVLRENPGRGGSAFVHDHVGEGDSLTIRGPRNHFELELADPGGGYLLIAGGIGITPLRPMVYELAGRGRQWSLVYGGRTASSMAYAEELRAEFSGNVVLYPQDRHGLLDLDRILACQSPDTAIYCCGPEPLLAEVERRCATSHPGRLHVERFALRPGARNGVATPFDVELAKSDRILHVPAHTTVLDVLREAGLDIPHACQNGLCGSCETRVLAGAPDHRDVILTANGADPTDRIMVCVSRSRTPTLTLDL
jgi:ferredoxin-NADP reductase/predicted amidohydrolase